jgi:hypothetical protein
LQVASDRSIDNSVAGVGFSGLGRRERAVGRRRLMLRCNQRRDLSSGARVTAMSV